MHKTSFLRVVLFIFSFLPLQCRRQFGVILWLSCGRCLGRCAASWRTRIRASRTPRSCWTGFWKVSSSVLRCFGIRILWVRIRIQHFWFNTDPDPNPGFWWKKIGKSLQLKIFLFFIFWFKIAIYLSLGLYKGRPGYMRSVHKTQYRTSSTSKIWNFLNFFLFLWVIFAPWIRIPDRLTWPD